MGHFGSALGRFWNSAPVVLVPAVFEIYGFLVTVAAIAASSVVGALTPALVQLGLALTPLQEWIIGVGTFTLFLAFVLNRLAPVVQNYSSARTQLKRQVGDLQSLQHDVKRLRDENERLTKKVIRYDSDRAALKEMLISAYNEGSNIRDNDPTQQQAEDWSERVGKLLKEASGDWLPKRILSDDPGAQGDRFSTTEQRWMDSRLERLMTYIKSLETQEVAQLRRGFNPHGRTWQTRD